jgi:hypothetical protein
MAEYISTLENCDKWIALYWTLAVPWAGHTELSPDADQASTESKTIQYQQRLVRRWAKPGRLIDEVIFMEKDAFRPSEKIIGVLERIAARCHQEGAGLVYVRFGGQYQVRYHSELENWIKYNLMKAGIPCIPIDAEGAEEPAKWAEDQLDTYNPKQLQPGLMDPFAHFRAWKTAHKVHKSQLPAHIKKVADVISELRNCKVTLSQVATDLNERKLFSTTGRPWTSESLRKFMKRYAE